MADEAGIAETGFVGDFASEPRGDRELAVRRIELDLGDDQALVVPTPPFWLATATILV